MNEVFPVVCGVGVGVLLGMIRPSLRLGVGVLLSLALGFTATVVSGEFAISWGFLLVDIPLVGVCAALAFMVSRAGRRALSGTIG